MQKMVVRAASFLFFSIQITQLTAFSVTHPTHSAVGSSTHSTVRRSAHSSRTIAASPPALLEIKTHKRAPVEGRILEQKLKSYIRSSDFYSLGLTARDIVRDGVTLERVKQIAVQAGFTPLVRAVNATTAIIKEHRELGLNEPELIQMAVFI